MLGYGGPAILGPEDERRVGSEARGFASLTLVRFAFVIPRLERQSNPVNSGMYLSFELV